jgi:gamma-glutamylcyclotransferase (GGCT)/AIG2-like uncharacterized protein YtfP
MTNKNVFYLFVYGSLRSGFHNPAYEYVSRYFNFVDKARVKGKLFDLGEYPAAIPVESNDFIIGELYLIKNESEFSWAIGQLDDYEGVNVEEGETQLYRRELTDIFIDKNIVKAWIYWYNGDVSGKPVVGSGDILEYFNKKHDG